MLRLRALEPVDLDNLYQWENDTSLWGISGYTTPFSKEALSKFITDSSNANTIFCSGQLRQIIEVDGIAIGCIDIFELESRHSRAGIGILIYDKVNHNKGYGEQALRQVISYSNDILGIHNLWAYIPSCNLASISLFKKVGFSKSGILRSWQFYDGNYSDVSVYQYLK